MASFAHLNLLFVCFAALGSLASADDACKNDKVLFCYYSSWAIYRDSLGAYQAKDVDPHLCTHLVYGFAGLNVDGEIFSLDPFNDLPEMGGNQQFFTIRELRNQNPCLKVLLSMGGWNEGSEKYSVMAETQESRKKFVDHLLRFLVYYGFDGIDIDWEYPTKRGGIEADRDNFVALLKDIKERFSTRNKLVCTAVGAAVELTDEAYDVKKIAEVVDYVLLMAYDYNQSNLTTYMAPLKRKTDDVNVGSVAESVEAWLSKGCPPEKLVLGMQTSGRSYILKNPKENGVGVPATNNGMNGPFLNTTGQLAYYEICDMLLEEPGWHVVSNDDIYASSYATKDENWIAYEDVETIKTKTLYAMSKNLAGVMVWTMDTDDFIGFCGEKNGLMNTIKSNLKV